MSIHKGVEKTPSAFDKPQEAKPPSFDFVHIMTKEMGQAPSILASGKESVFKDGKMELGTWSPESEVKKPAEQTMTAMATAIPKSAELNWDAAPKLETAQNQKVFDAADKKLELAFA